MAEHARQGDAGGLHQPLDRVQVGGADACAADPHEHVGRMCDLRPRPVDQLERLVILAEERRFHVKNGNCPAFSRDVTHCHSVQSSSWPAPPKCPPLLEHLKPPNGAGGSSLTVWSLT